MKARRLSLEQWCSAGNLSAPWLGTPHMKRRSRGTLTCCAAFERRKGSECYLRLCQGIDGWQKRGRTGLQAQGGRVRKDFQRGFRQREDWPNPTNPGDCEDVCWRCVDGNKLGLFGQFNSC